MVIGIKLEVENSGFQMSCNHLKEVQDNRAYIISQHVVKFLGSRCLSLHQELLSRTHAPSLSTVDWNHLIKLKKSILFSTRQGWANCRWHEAWGGKLRVSNVLQPFERSARQPCLHYFSACGEIPGLKVFVTASGTVEQDTCSIIVDCRLKSPDKVEKIYSFFNKTRLRHWWVCLLQTKKHNV